MPFNVKDKVRVVTTMTPNSALALDRLAERLNRSRGEVLERAVERMAMEVWLEEPDGGGNA